MNNPRPSLSLANSPVLDMKIPYSPESEIRLIGAIFQNNDTLAEVSYLRPDDFRSSMRDVYAAMQKVAEKPERITPMSVLALLSAEATKNLAQAGNGSASRYLMLATAMYDGVVPASDYARHIHQLAKKERISDIFGRAMADLCTENDEKSPEDHIAEVRAALDQVEENGQVDMFTDNLQVSERIVKEVGTKSIAYSTGIAGLDDAMGGGLIPCKSYGFAARKKTGKTALAATISANLNVQKVPHLFICGEMSPMEVQQRILARYTESYTSVFRSEYGHSPAFLSKLTQAVGNMPRCTFYHNAPGLTFAKLRRIVTAAVERKKVKGFILDYWQLVGGMQKGQNKADHLEEVAQWIADYSRKREIWSITMAQINQDGNTRGSEGIRLAFDQVYELHRQEGNSAAAWLEMMETRYTPWKNIGAKDAAGLLMEEKGIYFHEPIPPER